MTYINEQGKSSNHCKTKCWNVGVKYVMREFSAKFDVDINFILSGVGIVIHHFAINFIFHYVDFVNLR